MIVGVPREIKNEEHRVGLLPDGVARLIGQGHQVVIERRGQDSTPVIPMPITRPPARRWSIRTTNPFCARS